MARVGTVGIAFLVVPAPGCWHVRQGRPEDGCREGVRQVRLDYLAAALARLDD